MTPACTAAVQTDESSVYTSVPQTDRSTPPAGHWNANCCPFIPRYCVGCRRPALLGRLILRGRGSLVSTGLRLAVAATVGLGVASSDSVAVGEAAVEQAARRMVPASAVAGRGMRIIIGAS